MVSPLLLSLIVEGLLIKLHNKGYNYQGYADDLVVVIRGKCDKILSNRTQKAHRSLGRPKFEKEPLVWYTDRFKKVQGVRIRIVDLNQRLSIASGQTPSILHAEEFAVDICRKPQEWDEGRQHQCMH